MERHTDTQKIKVFAVYVHDSNLLFFASHSVDEAMKAVSFAHVLNVIVNLKEEELTLDEADSYFMFNASENNQLGLKYQQQLGEENAGTTTITTESE